MDLEVSHHAAKRIRERLGINKRGALREAQRAYYGITWEEARGKLRNWMINKSQQGKDLRVTPAGAFVFSPDGICVTVINLPPYVRAEALEQWKLRQL